MSLGPVDDVCTLSGTDGVSARAYKIDQDPIPPPNGVFISTPLIGLEKLNDGIERASLPFDFIWLRRSGFISLLAIGG